MDGNRFDALTRHLANRDTSRRHLLSGLGGGLLAMLFGVVGDERIADAVICRGGGVLCAKDAQCCSGSCDDYHCTCEDPSQTLCHGRCADCCDDADCDVDQCQTCREGSCVACSSEQTCYQGACCTPATCQPGQCGDTPDGCGGSLTCGGCDASQHLFCCGGTCKGEFPAACSTDADCCDELGCCGGICKSVAGGYCDVADQCCSGLCAFANHTCCPVCPSGCNCVPSEDRGVLCQTGGGSHTSCGASSANCPTGEACFGGVCRTTCVPIT